MPILKQDEAKAALRMLAFVGPHDLTSEEMHAFLSLMAKLEATATETISLVDQGDSKVDEVLCNSGEFQLDLSGLGKDAITLDDIVRQGGGALDGACLAGVVVVRSGDKFYVGDYSFSFDEVSEKIAREIAADFSDDDEDEGDDIRSPDDDKCVVCLVDEHDSCSQDPRCSCCRNTMENAPC